MAGRVSRRGALLCAAALVGSGSRVRAADVDVVIVGAGSAGLAAAKRLRTLGRVIEVVEARDRIGGRVFTDARLGPAFDAGAQYVHWAETNPWAPIATALGFDPRSDDGGNPPLIYANGLVVPERERGRRRRAFSRIDALISAGASPDRSIAAAVSAGGADVAEAARGLTRLTLGEEPDRVSAADYDQLWSGDDLLMAAGYGALVARYGADVPVRLGTPVRRIAWDGVGIRAETERGTIAARAAIVTVPVGVLQAGGIAFAPGLPPETAIAIDGLAMGAYTKIALRIDPARLDASRLADSIDLETPEATTSFEMRPFGRDLVIAYFGGDFARRLCEAGEGEAIRHATERLGAVAGADAARAVTGGILADWWTDPFSRGGYSIARPGRLAAREALRLPVGNRIWLAGEASAGGGAMTAGGAFLDGERAADAVSRALGG